MARPDDSKWYKRYQALVKENLKLKAIIKELEPLDAHLPSHDPIAEECMEKDSRDMRPLATGQRSKTLIVHPGILSLTTLVFYPYISETWAMHDETSSSLRLL